MQLAKSSHFNSDFPRIDLKKHHHNKKIQFREFLPIKNNPQKNNLRAIRFAKTPQNQPVYKIALPKPKKKSAKRVCTRRKRASHQNSRHARSPHQLNRVTGPRSVYKSQKGVNSEIKCRIPVIKHKLVKSGRPSTKRFKRKKDPPTKKSVSKPKTRSRHFRLDSVVGNNSIEPKHKENTSSQAPLEDPPITFSVDIIDKAGQIGSLPIQNSPPAKLASGDLMRPKRSKAPKKSLKKSKQTKVAFGKMPAKSNISKRPNKSKNSRKS